MRIAGQRSIGRGILAMLGAYVLMLGASAAPAVAAPQWRIESMANTAAAPGGQFEYSISLINVGPETPAGIANGPTTLNAALPPGITALQIEGNSGNWNNGNCPGGIVGKATFSCFTTAGLSSHDSYSINLKVAVDPGASGVLTASFEMSGGGASNIARTADPTLISAAPSKFGFDSFDAQSTGKDGAPYIQAAGHPYQLSTYIDFSRFSKQGGLLDSLEGPMFIEDLPVELIKDVAIELPPGVIGNPTVPSQCTAAALSLMASAGAPIPACPIESQVGSVRGPATGITGVLAATVWGPWPLYNMVPRPGDAATFGFNFLGTAVTVDAHLRSDGDFGVTAMTPNIPVALGVSGAYVNLWGTAGDHGHDFERRCPDEEGPYGLAPGPSCESTSLGKPFLRLPTVCNQPGEGVVWRARVDSWDHPGAKKADDTPDLSDPSWVSEEVATHKAPGFPYSPNDPTTPWGEEQGLDGCDGVPVKGNLAAKPTVLEVETSSGIDVHVEVPNPGLANPDGVAASDVKDVTVKLPQGLTLNPSQATGLGVCSSAQYESTELSFNPDGKHGCPTDSKVGTIAVHTPLLEETIPGAVYVAKPYDNPFDSLLALYIVLEEPERGVLVKLPGQIRLNETTGRIETEFGGLPQVPFTSFDFHFREGARAPLVTPPTCGTYTTEAQIEGYSKPGKPITSKSSFEITKGIGGGPCPPGGVPGFKPLFSAGSVNNSAGAFSPFNMRIQRADGEQDMTKFSSVLPPGVLGKLAGVAKCPDAAIAAAKAKSGIQEQQSPSCPASSEIGRSIVGAGVGSVLTYIPGKIYLGGPFNGDPLSVIAITPAVAGPFDVGTVVVHAALTLNPKTAEVEVDGEASDPIPHILKGIPAKLRDLRIYVDRNDFILNPTSCEPSSAKATLFGSAADIFSPADDIPVALSDRYQAASCSSLGFKPRLALNLKGGTSRGAFPGLSAVYKPREGDANLKGLAVRLPSSAFLEQGHIRTICTRVQFAADSCPAAAQYGYIKAWTPLLEEPLQGPVYLRSSDHKLPDLVFDLHGLVDVEVSTRIDSQHGGIRATLDSAPDAPISKVVLRMQGGKKGLIVNSRNLCAVPSRANVTFGGQNGKEANVKSLMRATCGKAKKHAKRHNDSRHR